MRHDGLTPQQLRVAKLVAEGWTDKRIASDLHIKPATVRFHVRRIAAILSPGADKRPRSVIVQRFTNAA